MKLFTTWLLILTLGWSFAASAAEKHKKASVNVQEVKRKKQKKPTKGEAPGRSGISASEIFAVEVQKKLITGIDKTIRVLRRNEKSLPKKSQARLKILVKIHNLHMEQAVYTAGEENRMYAKKHKAWMRNKRRGPEPKLSTRRSTKHWKKVSSTAQEILSNFPKAQSADVISLNRGLAFLFLKKEKLAARTFSDLVRKYPNSSVAGDAYYSLGDYYFDRNNYRNALTNYTSALKYRKSKRYGWALFKIAWSNFNLGQYRDAVKFFKKTVSHSKRLNRSKGVRLKEEALRDIVYPFSELKMESEAIRYFEQNGGRAYIAPLLTMLAETYEYNGKHRRAIKVWQTLQRKIPNHPKAAHAQFQIVDISSFLGDWKNVWKGLEVFQRRYGKGSPWARKNMGTDKELVLETQKTIHDKALYYPKVAHKKGNENESKALVNEAKKGYKNFISMFKKSREVIEVKFLLADIEFQHKSFKTSGDLYREIALSGKQKAVIYKPNGKVMENIHKKSSQYMLDSYSNDFDAEFKKLVKRKPDFSKKGIPISPKAKRFIQGCQFYTKSYPKDKKMEEKCDKYVAEIYYRSGNRKEAEKQLWFLIKKYPGKKAGIAAAENVIPMYKKDKLGLAKVVGKLLAISAYKRGKFGKKLLALKRATELEAIAAEKDKNKRALRWEQRAKKNPRDSEAGTFWFNAAVAYIDSGEVDGAIRSYSSIVKSYPKHKTYQQSWITLAQLYDHKLDFGNASKYYLGYATRYPKAKESAGSIQRACNLQIAMESNSALGTCLKLKSIAIDNARVAVYKLIELNFRKKNYSKMQSLINGVYLKQFKLTPSQKIEVLYRVYETNGKKRSTANQITAIVRRNLGKISGEALRYAGELVFKTTDVGLKPYLKIGLQGGTVEKLSASIQKKANALTKLEARYQDVFNTKDSYWAVAAFHQVGQAYENFAKQMQNPPAIKGAKPEDVKKQLSGDAAAFMKVAMERYKQGLMTGRKFGIYSPWVGRIRTSINRNSNKRISYDDWIVEPDFLGSDINRDVVEAAWLGK